MFCHNLFWLLFLLENSPQLQRCILQKTTACSILSTLNAQSQLHLALDRHSSYLLDKDLC